MKQISSLTPKNGALFSLVHKLSQTVKALAANENDICENSRTTVCKREPSPISPMVKMRWKQLARNAFIHSVDQKVKKQPSNSSHSSNGSTVKCSPVSLSPHSGFQFRKSNLIDLLSLNGPSSEEMIICQRIDDWVQLSGHEDSFALAGPGTIWKKRSSDSTEVHVYESLMREPISEMIPKFYRDVQYKGDNFIELEDLLYNYKDASIMDIKMGCRTFLESEVMNGKARNDLYEKMVKIDPHEPTAEEHASKAVTKLRYMQFRETLSSSSNFGFRIEGFKVGSDVKHNQSLQLIKCKEQVQQTLASFFHNKPTACQAVVRRLRKLRKYFENSPFFQRHQVIGSSLLIIHKGDKAGVWMIDFAKTVPLPENTTITHRSPWKKGNHEDGYLFGLDNLISILDDVQHP